MLFALSASARYSAVIECVPSAKLDLVSWATPRLNRTVPNAWVPSRKVTLPVGPVEPVPVTCAVNVTHYKRAPL